MPKPVIEVKFLFVSVNVTAWRCFLDELTKSGMLLIILVMPAIIIAPPMVEFLLYWSVDAEKSVSAWDRIMLPATNSADPPPANTHPVTRRLWLIFCKSEAEGKVPAFCEKAGIIPVHNSRTGTIFFIFIMFIFDCCLVFRLPFTCKKYSLTFRVSRFFSQYRFFLFK